MLIFHEIASFGRTFDTLYFLGPILENNLYSGHLDYPPIKNDY